MNFINDEAKKALEGFEDKEIDGILVERRIEKKANTRPSGGRIRSD